MSTSILPKLPCLQLRLYSGILLSLTLIISFGQCGRVQLFKNANFKDFLKEVQLPSTGNSTCIRLNNSNTSSEILVGSVKTDTCIMIYSDLHCTAKGSSSISWRLDKNDPRFEAEIGSFRACSQRWGGGPQIDVDFYSEPDHEGPITAQFRNVCSCTNIPERVEETWEWHKALSVDNHGNGIVVYLEENCRGISQIVEAGNNHDAKWLCVRISSRPLTLNFNIRSFQPVNTVTC